MGNYLEIIGSIEFESICNLEIDIKVNDHGRLKAEGILTERAFWHCMKMVS